MADNVGAFDVNAFLTQTYEEAGEVNFTPLPECETAAAVKKLDVRALPGGQVVADVTWDILDEAIKASTGLTNPTVRQGIFLDLDANGRIAWGKNKNVALGRLREAVGQNVAGVAWGPGMLIGQVAKIKVTQRPGTKPEEIAAGRVYNDVAMVTKLA